ncbi:type II toxin-antitoxin system RelE/ParE family toxin [Nocardia africana]
MSRYLLAPAARADLDDIYDYTARQWGTEQAETYVRGLQHAIERAAADPRVGRRCDEIRPRYHALAAGSHTLYYRLTDVSAVDIVRILHRHTDVDRQM